jgi:ribonuclease Z
VALRLAQRGEVWLFDCGEATQHQILRSDIKLSQITRIFITHLHGDHVFGLTGLLATCGMAGQGQRIDVYGPAGLAGYLNAASLQTQTHYNYPVEVHTAQKGIVYEDDEYVVTSDLLKHRVPAYGYRVEERERSGRFDAERAQSLGIPFGPLYGKLKRGESITLADGRVVDGRDLCGASEAGRSVVYCTDTIFCESAIALAEGADLLIHEATFAEADEHLARQSLHSTTTMAARVAHEAQVKRLVLTHFSPRYVMGNAITPDDLLNEAQAIFPQTELAHDFLVVEVARRNAPAN